MKSIKPDKNFHVFITNNELMIAVLRSFEDLNHPRTQTLDQPHSPTGNPSPWSAPHTANVAL
jgi:hypothetical protein